ncbi:MAG: HK97 gp10 family phage protein [Bacteroidales bacterium]|nr:HK97 gp10 family phage protein [Bacteroidales bacterium]
MSTQTYTSHGVSVKFDDNSPQVLDALQKATVRGLEACGAMAESYAKKELSKPKTHRDGSVRPNVVTGRLRNSISYALGSNVGNNIKVYIGSNVSYAPFLEFGTRKMSAYPYLKPACTEHTEEYKKILQSSLQNA